MNDYERMLTALRAIVADEHVPDDLRDDNLPMYSCGCAKEWARRALEGKPMTRSDGPSAVVHRDYHEQVLARERARAETAEAALAASRADYATVADAIMAQSTSPAELAAKCRALREVVALFREHEGRPPYVEDALRRLEGRP